MNEAGLGDVKHENFRLSDSTREEIHPLHIVGLSASAVNFGLENF